MAQTIPCDFCQEQGEVVIANFLVTVIGDPVPKSACMPCFAMWGKACQDIVDKEYAELAAAAPAPTDEDNEDANEDESVEPATIAAVSEPEAVMADGPVA